MEDELIVDLFYERSEQAISELSAKYGKLAHSICNNILKCSSDAEECVNDSLFTTWNQIPPTRPTSLKAYFINVVRNKALDKYRFNSSEKRNSHFDVAIDELTECISSGETPADTVEADMLADAINAFLGGIEKTDRIMFVSRYYLSDSVSNISRKLNLKESVVSVRLYRTREKLRKYLEKENLI